MGARSSRLQQLLLLLLVLLVAVVSAIHARPNNNNNNHHNNHLLEEEGNAVGGLNRHSDEWRAERRKFKKVSKTCLYCPRNIKVLTIAQYGVQGLMETGLVQAFLKGFTVQKGEDMAHCHSKQMIIKTIYVISTPIWPALPLRPVISRLYGHHNYPRHYSMLVLVDACGTDKYYTAERVHELRLVPAPADTLKQLQKFKRLEHESRDAMYRGDESRDESRDDGGERLARMRLDFDVEVEVGFRRSKQTPVTLANLYQQLHAQSHTAYHCHHNNCQTTVINVLNYLQPGANSLISYQDPIAMQKYVGKAEAYCLACETFEFGTYAPGRN